MAFASYQNTVSIYIKLSRYVLWQTWLSDMGGWITSLIIILSSPISMTVQILGWLLSASWRSTLEMDIL
jgi:hypothetical protein